MWYLYIVNILNAALDNKGIILEYRIELAGMPINLLDGLLGLGVICAFVNVFMNSNRMRTPGIHRAQSITIVLFAFAIIAGIMGASINNAPLRPLITDLRNVVSFPLCMLLAYGLMNKPSSAAGFVRSIILGGIAAAALILLFFVGKSATETKVEVEHIRAVQYISNYAGWACAVLLFVVVGGHRRRMPLILAWIIIAFCLLGQFATLSRSDWLPATASILIVPLILPPGKRGSRFLMFLVAVPLLIGVLIVGTSVASQLTGRDLNRRMYDRVLSMLPGQGEAEVRGSKAWDTRTGAMMQELRIWVGSPIIGDGFAYHRVKGHEALGHTYQHNVWTSALAMNGIAGFLAYLVPLVACIVVGYRMLRESPDPGMIALGGLGVISGVYNIIQGMATLAFNVQRTAMAVGFVVGAVLRARAMQLAQPREEIPYSTEEELAALADRYEHSYSSYSHDGF